MTTEEFIGNVQKLYGRYSPAQAKVVTLWLDKYKGELNVLIAEVLRSVSWREYRTPPGPKEFEDVAREIRKAAREAGRPELRPYVPFPLEECLPMEETAGLMRDLFKKLTDKANVSKKDGNNAENQKVL